jgi:FMN-binding domain
MRLHCGIAFLLLLALGPASAEPGVETLYQEPAAFLQEVFAGDVPRPARLWIKPELRTAIREVLGHELGRLRVRYWQRGDRTAWILEDIGKEQLITTGLVVDGDRLADIRVLIYRESRGWEVKYPAFTDQFRGARLNDERLLDRGIDGISGATLSVHTLTRLARLALLLDQHVPS